MHSIDTHVRITYFSVAQWSCLALHHQQYYSETEISIPNKYHTNYTRTDLLSMTVDSSLANASATYASKFISTCEYIRMP
jgi:hypothetical protein